MTKARKEETRPVSIRIPISMLAQIKGLAKEKDMPYQKLIKEKLWEILDD